MSRFNLDFFCLQFHFHLVQALIALKNGAQLLKYKHKGKPKFYPIRLSNVRLQYYVHKDYLHYALFNVIFNIILLNFPC